MSVFNQSRSRVIRLIFLLACLVIIAQLLNLQVFSSKYSKLAMDNAVFPKIVYPERGIIYDRKGKAILNNAIMFDLMVTPAEVKNFDTASFCSLMEIDKEEFISRIRDARFRGYSVRPSVFQSILSPKLQQRFAENSWRYPGFAMVERPVRVYPYNAAGHLLGYVSEVSPSDIEKSNNFYRMGDYIGKNGLESYYERILMGERGVEHLIKDNRNRLVGKYEGGVFDTAAVAGRGLKTYLDIDMQVMAERMMTDKVGGLVAIDPRTGGILAMASGPTFNPNDLTGPDKGKNYGKLVLDVAGPFINRAIQGRYEPGSTFKPLGGLIALDEGLITPSYGYPCAGVYTACGIGKPRCTHSNPGHARDLRTALANSCNSYFTQVYRMAVDNPRIGRTRAGYNRWKEYLNSFGLGQRLGVDLPGEIRGFIPDTSDYDREYRGSWSSCTNLTLGIGQDKMLATPLQLANAMCIIANKGYYYTPHLVRSIEDEREEDSAFLNQFKVKHDVLTHIPDDYYEAIMDGMEDVVVSGTARNARIENIRVCAKTGTAEKYIYMDRQRIKLENNAVFVAFAPRENPTIAIAVIVENAGYGGTWGGPIARILMEKYLNDTLTTASQAEYERVSTTNKMPSYLKRFQYITDSTRAQEMFRMTKDSAYIRKYVGTASHRQPSVPPTREKAPAPQPEQTYSPQWAWVRRSILPSPYLHSNT